MQLTEFQMGVAVGVAGRVDQEISDYVLSKPKWQWKTAFEKKMLSDWEAAKKRQMARLRNGVHEEFMSEGEFYDHVVREFVFNYSFPISTSLIEYRLSADAVPDDTLASEKELLVEICLELVGERINSIDRPKETIVDRLLKQLGYTKPCPKIFRETRSIDEIGLYWMKTTNVGNR